MSERYAQLRQQPGKNGPILPARSRPGGTDWQRQEFLPELVLVTGRDRVSSGIHAHALLPSGGQYPSPVTLVDVRWKDPILSLEELVLVTVRGLEAYCAEAGYDLPPR